MTTLFSDDFESGDLTAWDSQTDTANVSADVNTDAALNGTYGLDCAGDNASDSNNQSYTTVNFNGPASEVVVIDFEFEWDAWTRGGYNSATSKAVVAFWNNDSGASKHDRMVWLNVQGERVLQCCYHSKDGTDTKITGTYTFTLGTTYSIRIVCDFSGSNPVITWYVDDTEIGSATDSSSGSSGLGQFAVGDQVEIIFGIIHINQWEKIGYVWFVDDVLVSDEIPAAADDEILGADLFLFSSTIFVY
jgi:hypothetical protein